MIIKICDRCGKKIEPDITFTDMYQLTQQIIMPRYQIKLNNGEAWKKESTEIHLCDDCNKALNSWLEGYDKPEEFRSKMKTLAEDDDPESFHSYADDLMCETLTELGYGEGVKIFEDEEKWYS